MSFKTFYFEPTATPQLSTVLYTVPVWKAFIISWHTAPNWFSTSKDTLYVNGKSAGIAVWTWWGIVNYKWVILMEWDTLQINHIWAWPTWYVHLISWEEVNN